MAPLTPRDHGRHRTFWTSAIKDVSPPTPSEVVGRVLNQAARNTRMPETLRTRVLVRRRLVYGYTEETKSTYAPGTIILVNDEDIDWLKSEGYIELLPDDEDGKWGEILIDEDEEQREEELAQMRKRWRRAKKHRRG